MAQRQCLVNILSKSAPYMDRQRKARKREPANVQTEKEEKDEHLKLLTMPHTICFEKIIKN